MILRALLVTSLVLGGATSPARAQQASAAEVVVPNVAFPTGIVFASDGTMYFAERAGRLRVVRDGRLDPDPVMTAETTTTGETGFLGLALSPADGDLYVFATEPSGSSNSVLRVSPEGGEPEAVVRGLPGGGYHNGGGVAFDASGRELFVSNGEIHDSGRSQDPASLGGKVYRFSPDGDPIADNPFGADSATYALGLRNPYGLAIDPISTDPFVTENGPSSNDEVNHIRAGGNYGWPAVQGTVGDVGDAEATFEGRYFDPLLDYPEIIVPTGITFADPRNAAPAYAGDLFFGAYGERSIHRVRLDEDRQVVSDTVFVQETEPVIAVAWGPRGLYYSTPGAIKLLPLARGEPSAAPPFSPGTETDDSGLRLDRIAVALAAVVAIAGVAWFWRRKRQQA